MNDKKISRGTVSEFIFTLIALVALGVSGAILLPIAEAGYSSLQQLAIYFLIPGLVVLIVIYFVAWILQWHWLRQGLVSGLWIGAISTIGLEVIRMIGFHFFQSMPGDLPTLMGVLLTGRIMQGPDHLSTFLGYADHFWNGAAFGIIYVLVFGKQKIWITAIYGLSLGTGFLISPVVTALGVGPFGIHFGIKFAVTVYLAHLSFGVLIGWLSKRSAWVGNSVFRHFFHNHDSK